MGGVVHTLFILAEHVGKEMMETAHGEDSCS